MTPFKTLYDRVQIIIAKLREAQSKKSLVGQRLCALKFGIGDQFSLHVSPMKDLMRLGKGEKLSLRSRLFVDIRINVELISNLIRRFSFEVDGGNRLFYSFNAFHKESILSGKSYCMLHRDINASVIKKGFPSVCPVINIEGEGVEYGYGGGMEGYVVPKNNSFGALEEDVGYIFPLGDTSPAKREYIKAYVLEVTTSKQSFVEEKPMEGFDFVRCMELPYPYKVLFNRILLTGTLSVRDFVGTIESELSIMGVIPDEFVLITGVGRDVGVSDNFVKVGRKDKLQTRLRSEGRIMALLGMVRCRHPDLLSQVGRGIANFAKCKSRVSTQVQKTRQSSLIEDGALTMVVQNSNKLALHYLAELISSVPFSSAKIYARYMISGGALWELIHISRDYSRDDIRSLACQTLSSLASQVTMQRLRIELELSYWFHSRDGYKEKFGVPVSPEELVYYKFVLQKSSSNLRRLPYSRMSSDLRFCRKWLRGYWGDFWIPSILASILLVFWNMLPKEPLFKWWNLLKTKDNIENNVGRIKRGAGCTVKSGISTPRRFHSKRFTVLGKTLIGEVD
ncbi:Armadillo repeat-containing kinesin-like protein 2 [Capsicum baccatum]|uniref:Armadillo repeat-containing kinesin-like protein 2 n=1 Tax=Capsicum baccatum TaxID=33114 RepID=A0A2G2W0A7_CAPBA|nr:Armadillo repeat-containing kinesin-like protein 2 [Capsicum baccatum]